MDAYRKGTGIGEGPQLLITNTFKHNHMNIYVSNLQSYFKDEDLHALFAPYGNIVSSKVIMDRYTGTSRGFGFVEMSTAAEGQEAIKELDGKVIDGRAIGVSVAKERSERSGNGRSFR